jgi:hypothetical protein
MQCKMQNYMYTQTDAVLQIWDRKVHKERRRKGGGWGGTCEWLFGFLSLSLCVD